MQLMVLRPNTPHFDTKNPDPAQRQRPLCGLEIGSGFRPEGETKAVDGRLYDPQSGKTYHGEVHTEGDSLHLRGYIGISAFGRSETWKRVSAVSETCHDR